MSQIRLHKSKQKPFVVCCAGGIVPRFGQDGFQIGAKLSACQISGTGGEEFGKLYIKVLLRQGYPAEKMRFTMLGFSIRLVYQRTSCLKIINTIRMFRCLKPLQTILGARMRG